MRLIRNGCLAIALAGVGIWTIPAFGQQTTPAPPASQPAITAPQTPAQPAVKGRSPGGDIGSGTGDVAKGAGRGAGSAAKGVGKGAADLATLHPINAAGNVGKGAAVGGKDVAVGAGKGTGKILKGAGRGIKKIF